MTPRNHQRALTRAHLRRAGCLIVVVALAVAAAGCGGESVFSATTQASTTTSTTTSIVTTSTTTTSTSTTTTTTIPPTTTTTVPPLPIAGWDGAGVDQMAVVLDFEHPAAATEMRGIVNRALIELGIDDNEDSEAVMEISLTGWGNSATYENVGTCYTGAHIQGSLTLTAPGQSTIELWLSGDRAQDWVIFGDECAATPESAPYSEAFERPFVEAVVDIWGVGSVPLLLDVMNRPMWDSQVELPLWAAVVDAFASFDQSAIATEDVHRFLGLVIDGLERAIDITDHGFIAASRRLLTSFSGTDFGFADEADLDEWRGWLEEWMAQQ